MTLEEIIDNYGDEDLLKADGFDEAVIGIEINTGRLVYDIFKMRELLIKNDGMSSDDAMEYLDFNVLGAYMGEKTPIYVQI
jgi:hypothetical protein